MLKIARCFFVFCCFIMLSRLAVAQALLTDITVQPVAKTPQIQISLILDADQPVGYKSFSLSDPARIVIDLPETSYHISDQKNIHLSYHNDYIKNFRHGIHDHHKLRLVFDLTQPLKLLNSQQREHKIILNFIALNGIQKNITENVDSPSLKKSIFTVAIDPGHGGKDVGATGLDGAHEKNITFAIAKILEALVNQQPHMKAILTRHNDSYVGLRQRLLNARKAKSNIFISIHADAFNEPDAKGASVFALSLHGSSSEAALWLAKKENYSELSGIDLNHIQDQDSVLRSVLIDLSQTASITASFQLGHAVIQSLGQITELHHGMVEQAPFMVLKSPDIPSILVETGFITNPQEETRLKTPDYQKKIAQAIMTGIKHYYQLNSGQCHIKTS